MSFFGLNICKQDLPSKELYDAWNKKLSSIDINRECTSAKSTYEHKNNDTLLRICSMALEYIETDDEMPPKKKLSSCNRCKLFNYWVLNKLQEIFKNDHRTAFNYLTFMMTQKNIVNFYSKENACKIDFNIVTDKEYDVKKQFYEYLEDYRRIDMRSKMNDPECTKYKEYFETRRPLGRYILKILPYAQKNDFSAIYGKDNKCNTNNILTKLINNNLKFTEEDSEEDSEETLSGVSFLEAVYNIKTELLNYELTHNPFSYLKLQWDYGINKLKNSSPYAMPSILSVAGVSAASMFFY